METENSTVREGTGEAKSGVSGPIGPTTLQPSAAEETYGFLRRPKGSSRLRAELADPNWYCYILRNKNPRYANLTYNGSTNNPKRRLRQHNGEISGGAVYTKKAPGDWEIYFLMTGFPDHKNTLSCEWRIKHTEGKPRSQRPPQHRGMKGRIVALNDILQLDKQIWVLLNCCFSGVMFFHYVLFRVFTLQQMFQKGKFEKLLCHF
jgi:predicted GIY-YIG superfamily endonuclease